MCCICIIDCYMLLLLLCYLLTCLVLFVSLHLLVLQALLEVLVRGEDVEARKLQATGHAALAVDEGHADVRKSDGDVVDDLARQLHAVALLLRPGVALLGLLQTVAQLVHAHLDGLIIVYIVL